jgi:hypothetical protein
VKDLSDIGFRLILQLLVGNYQAFSYKSLTEGDRVSFDIGKDAQGPAAENVRKL